MGYGENSDIWMDSVGIYVNVVCATRCCMLLCSYLAYYYVKREVIDRDIFRENCNFLPVIYLDYFSPRKDMV